MSSGSPKLCVCILLALVVLYRDKLIHQSLFISCFQSFSAMRDWGSSIQVYVQWLKLLCTLNIKAEMNSPFFPSCICLLFSILYVKLETIATYLFICLGKEEIKEEFSQTASTFVIALYTTQCFTAVPKWSSAILKKFNIIRSAFFRPFFFLSLAHKLKH